MDGIINILKPPEMTSFDVVSALRGILKTKKVGHTGTLDPMVSGVLPVCAGKATKAAGLLTETNKVYRCEMTLGITTDTQDSTGTITEKNDVDLSKDEIIQVIMSFIGPYRQIPPMYSAKKINGKRLYQLARAGQESVREAVNVTIKSISVVDIYDNKVLFDVNCSKGTYIRTLCEDIGNKLGCGAHMSFLVRKQSGSFKLSDSVTLKQVQQCVENNTINDLLIQTDKLFEDYPAVFLDVEQARNYKNGMTTLLGSNKGEKTDLLTENSYMRVYEQDERLFLGIGRISTGSNNVYIKTKKFF